MKLETITTVELELYKISVPYDKAFLKTLDDFIALADSEKVLHVTLDNKISTERQRVKRLQKLFPRFEALDFKFKNIEEIGHAFISLA